MVYNTAMTSHHEQPPRSKDALLARFLGNALEHDREDVKFWRTASEQLRGQTLYRLRARGKAMHDVVPHVIEQRDDAIRLVLRPHQIELLTGYE
ncbi:MAG: hypothetical protein ACYDCQ_01700 [Dehalococcoidia bacterium]